MLSELPECKIILVEKNHKTSCEVLPKKKCYPESYIASTAALPLSRVPVTSICALLLHTYQCSLSNSTLVHRATKSSRLHLMFKFHHISVTCFSYYNKINKEAKKTMETNNQ